MAFTPGYVQTLNSNNEREFMPRDLAVWMLSHGRITRVTGDVQPGTSTAGMYQVRDNNGRIYYASPALAKWDVAHGRAASYAVSFPDPFPALSPVPVSAPAPAPAPAAPPSMPVAVHPVPLPPLVFIKPVLPPPATPAPAPVPPVHPSQSQPALSGPATTTADDCGCSHSSTPAPAVTADMALATPPALAADVVSTPTPAASTPAAGSSRALWWIVALMVALAVAFYAAKK